MFEELLEGWMKIERVVFEKLLWSMRNFIGGACGVIRGRSMRNS